MPGGHQFLVRVPMARQSEVVFVFGRLSWGRLLSEDVCGSRGYSFGAGRDEHYSEWE
jgi:hypothetical protein